MTTSIDDPQEILRSRARALAKTPEITPELGTTLKLLEFRLAQESYAVESQYVLEVQPLKELTPLPCTPAFVRGIVNLRGRILPVLDLKRFLDLPEQGIGDFHSVIFVKGGDFVLGLLADIVIGVRTLTTHSLVDHLPTLSGIRGEYIKGITAERLVVLDFGRILADPKLIVADEVET
jgi:purine-binding chemotaxis protein CheW